MQLLARLGFLRRRLSGVPFESQSGIRVNLDIPTDRFLFLSGRLAPEPLEIAIATRMVRPGDVFVDVGAHWGLYLLHVLGRLGADGAYFAIEPSPSNVAFLRNSISAGDARLEIHQVAVADSERYGKLENEGNVCAHLSEGGGDAVDVRVSRLDSVLRHAGLQDARVFIKMDIEGREAAAIRGCKGLADAGIFPIFLLEFLTERFGQTRDDILGALVATFGEKYSYWAIDGDRGGLVRFERPDEIAGSIRNIIAIPSGSLDRISDCPQFPDSR